MATTIASRTEHSSLHCTQKLFVSESSLESDGQILHTSVLHGRVVQVHFPCHHHLGKLSIQFFSFSGGFGLAGLLSRLQTFASDDPSSCFETAFDVISLADFASKESILGVRARGYGTDTASRVTTTGYK
jgi:hypothetical protein